MPAQLEKQTEILAKMKAMDIETYEEIFRTLTAPEFAELYYRMQEVLGCGEGIAMPPEMLNKYTELFWQVNEIFQKHVTPERKAFINDMKMKTEEEVMAEYALQQRFEQ